MSQPPTSSPSTNSCGIVGQFESADSSWRIRGSGRTSTAANGRPSAWRIPTVRAEKPHMGWSGVPFMNRSTGLSVIACWIESRKGFWVSVMWVSFKWFATSGGLRRELLTISGLDGEGVDAAAELISEDAIDEPVLRNAAEPTERRRHHHRVKMVTVSGDRCLGAGDSRLDAGLQLLGRGGTCCGGGLSHDHSLVVRLR